MLLLLSLSLPSETPSSHNQSTPAGPAGVIDNWSIFRVLSSDLHFMRCGSQPIMQPLGFNKISYEKGIREVKSWTFWKLQHIAELLCKGLISHRLLKIQFCLVFFFLLSCFRYYMGHCILRSHWINFSDFLHMSVFNFWNKSQAP